MLYPLSYEGGRGPQRSGRCGDELCASAGPGRSSQRGENRVLLVTLDLLGIEVFAASGALAAVCGTCCSARSPDRAAAGRLRAGGALWRRRGRGGTGWRYRRGGCAGPSGRTAVPIPLS